MAFFGGGGSGFGQTNQSSGFGTGTGFGAANTGTGFGSTPSAFGGATTGNTGGGLFGNTSSGFGAGTNSGFGSNTQSTSAFGGAQNTRPGGFGTNTNTGSTLFGSTTPNTGSGFGTGTGFGTTPTTTPSFGGSANTNTGLFGANKPATGFGASNTGGTGFGSSGTTGFGAGATSTGFGGTGTAFQGSQACEGTGGTPFSAFTEKDQTSSATNHYQSISFMQPYSKFSFEELRLADYQQGRRFGNASGQPGGFGAPAFGSSTGFGGQQASTGFGGAFGGSAATSAPSGFGATQTTGGFGAGTTGGNSLFSANKPATSLFNTNTAAPAQTGNSLFNSSNTTGGFGANTGATGGFGANTGSSLFTNNQQQNKPFGAGATTTGFGGGFGATQTTSSATPFGATTATASPFGGAQQQQTGTSGFGGFGNTQNQAQKPATGLFANNTGGFGTNTQQQSTPSGGLFSNNAPQTNTGASSSIFGAGQAQQGQSTSSIFGNNQNQQPASGGGIFGNAQNQQKPTGSIFGTSNAGAATGGAFGSGFGTNQTQQNTGGLFASTQTQQAKPGGLFSNSTASTGGGLFGNQTTNQNAGSSLFGPTQSQQQQPAGSGFFGASQPAQQQPQQPVPGSFQASLLDNNPYGNQSIFSGLPSPVVSSPGPLATPLASSMKQKQRTPLPVHKITPSAANRLITPPKRQGYGFSYSTYGSPSSTLGTSSSGLGSSLLGSSAAGSLRNSISGSLGRSFSKSYSTSNLRKSFLPEEDSVLSPGALLPTGSRSQIGTLKRLTIDRSLRNDLFSRSVTPSAAPVTNGDDQHSADKLKKKVSFDSAPAGGEVVFVDSKSPEPTAEELGFLRSTRKSGSLVGIDGDSERPEMESTRHDLAIVPENPESASNGASVKRLSFIPGGDPQPGDYWMSPSHAELSKMTRDQLKKVVNFTVGRQNCGEVTFNGAVDLTTVDLDNIFDGIVDIGVRKITVYPDENVKPPMGKGLNVPSTLRIENSWPRGRDRKNPLPITSGPLFEKHVDRLRKVTDTEFVDYETDTGTWIFNVPHFTTYGLDYDEDEDENPGRSTLGAGPDDNRTSKAVDHHPQSFEQSATFSIDESFVGSMAGIDDDTFDFKKRKLVPGSFANNAMQLEDEEMVSEYESETFLEEGSAGSTIEQDDDFVTESQQSGDSTVGSDEDQAMDMAGSFPDLRRTVEHDDVQSTDSDMNSTHPNLKPFGTPSKPRLDLSGDWAEQLQRTISPRKQNRDALREMQANAFTDRPLLNKESPTAQFNASPKKGFANSIDLMNSLFQQQPRKQTLIGTQKVSKQQPKGFEWPYNKQPKTFAGDTAQMNESDVAFHASFKPRWGTMDSIICAKNDVTGSLSESNKRWKERFSVFSEGRDVAVLQFVSSEKSSDKLLDAQKQQSTVQRVDNTPLVRLPKPDLRQFALSASPSEESLVWQLANILFNDDIEDDISAGVPPKMRTKFADRIKKDRLTRLWESIVRDRHAHVLDSIRSPEERAVRLLCSHRIDEACKTLIDSHNLHLATLVAQIGRDATSRSDIANQIDVWRQNNVLSEINESIRALYELVAGNGLRSEGRSGGALEDRATTFSLTDRFELDWFQAFGLRLWYGITEDEPVEAAVAKFLDDLDTGLEPASPFPSHHASDKAPLQPGSDTLGRESPLWLLLKAYSATKLSDNSKITPIQLPAALLPESICGDRLSNRLSFQLHHVLVAAIGQSDALQIDQNKVDRLTWDYASELLARGELSAAIFVLLHLSRADDRKRAVQDTLARCGSILPDPSSADGSAPNSVWTDLTSGLQVPEAWIWLAKALHARDRGDAIVEVDCLIRGKHWNDAHATFCSVVGPTAVISRDYQTLERLLSGFGDGPERKMRGWSSGGGIYEDFLRLATAPRGRRDPTRLSRLVNALVDMSERTRHANDSQGWERSVALKEMSRAVAGWITHEDVHSVESSAILGLPLNGDARVLQTAEMSRRYYGIIMAGGQ
ncbi:Nucleoporin NUP145 [Penicillium ucsense]|uniref:Nucleoporin NUP145 n=1 Tax=Penicillium ucsense TaxID=2839758 RepID=A0A8J8WKL9_9EURO|nr:Nucleoporin NUP145 [Penicillium ucsense]KAF7736888.1 Nucleoporin NUP145 [Penicillium ucsense]